MKKFFSIALILFSLSNASDLSPKTESADDNDTSAEEIFSETTNQTAQAACEIMIGNMMTSISDDKERSALFARMFVAEIMPEIQKHKDDHIKLICEQLNPEERLEALRIMRHPLQAKLQQLGMRTAELIQNSISDPEIMTPLILKIRLAIGDSRTQQLKLL